MHLSGMRAEDVKAWLRSIQLEEDPKNGLANVDKGDNWRLFLKLAQAVWDHGEIPPQLLWVDSGSAHPKMGVATTMGLVYWSPFGRSVNAS